MLRLAHLISRVADAHLNMQMDQLMRVGILEGIAGVQVGAWKKLNPPARGLAEAEDFFAHKGETLDPRWFDLHDQGMFKAVLFTALQITKSREDAENIAQDIVSGLTRSEDTEGGQLYDLGKRKLRDDPSFDHAKGMMKNHARHRALSNVTRRREESLTMVDDDGGSIVQDVPNMDGRSTINEQLISFLNDPKGASLLQVIRKVLGREWAAAPSKLQILDAVIADPGRSDVGIARDLGHGENDPESWIMLGAATYVSRIRREIKKRIPEIVMNTPGLLAHLDLQQEMSGLGYGQQRWASRQARNLAIFLSTPIK